MSNPRSIDDAFLKKTEDAIEANLENEQFGVNELSEALGVSRSQLHRKLNALTGKSTSQFIREYRLEKAMELLQNNVATASEIAYRVGFSSPTYFNTRFSEYYGYPPGEVKYRNSNSSDGGSEKSSEVKESGYSIKNSKAENRKSFNRKNTIVAVFGGLFIIALLYFIFNNSKEKDPVSSKVVATLNKSLAVLPFKNLSDDNTNQYFADGMREDIINQLSKIKSISVKSRQSSDRYESGELSGLEIGNALGVDYLVNGSVQKHEDRIKIIVHLINTKTDTHLWSKDFDREFEDIFNLEKEISIDIAKELNLVLSPNELEQIGKIPTKNLEAYNLYLKGKHFLYNSEKRSFDSAEKYFNESIVHDPEFALPYSGLAEAYMYRSWPRTSEEDYLKAKKYALKGIALDSDLSETHRVLGMIKMEYERNWDEAEKEFKIALEKDPKSVFAHLHYGRYLVYVKGDIDKGMYFFKKAIQLDPVFIYPHIMIAECYIMMGDYELALKEVNKAKEIDNKDLWTSWIIFLSYVEQGKDDLAIEELRRSWSLYPVIKVNIEPMLEAYESSGIKGVFKWFNDMDINQVGEDNVYHSAYWIAEKFAFLGEHDKAMEWLEIAYSRNNSELYKLKYDHFFEDMHTHPEFLELLKKMNFSDYSHPATFKD
ncbi:helix-turn-helix domain-containing protein [Algibacter sp. 2305UL17-15]|uniref:helix-turn-helix domain-containing protein n=1 Tax=Algibacter sp. 2305UL17-15 TaxID=3231268 RepID=UPI0034588A1A